MILTSEDELRIKCEPVLPGEVSSLREALEKELRASEARGMPGIGLAAPQIGIAKRMAIVRLNNSSIDLVNCDIIRKFDEFIFENEGCLSFPNRFERTKRFREIHITNNLAEPHSFIATGLLAVVCQHEWDHVNGILLSDVALPKQEIKVSKKLRPNDKCFCGKNIKYKKCHGKK